jgi:hypothetical protein
MLKKQIECVNTRRAALCGKRDTIVAEIEAGALSDEQIAAMLATSSEDVITGSRIPGHNRQKAFFLTARLVLNPNPPR